MKDYYSNTSFTLYIKSLESWAYYDTVDSFLSISENIPDNLDALFDSTYAGWDAFRDVIGNLKKKFNIDTASSDKHLFDDLLLVPTKYKVRRGVNTEYIIDLYPDWNMALTVIDYMDLVHRLNRWSR